MGTYMETTNTVAVVVPNWDGEKWLKECIDSVLAQSYSVTPIIVDNGSKDSSRTIIENYGDKVEPIYLPQNTGFTGGVNAGIKYALEHNYSFIALLNNDAVADKDWIKHLLAAMRDSQVGISTSIILSLDGKKIDTTGDLMTTWGLSYPRSRGKDSGVNTPKDGYIFGASGGASMYRAQMLNEIGLFDQDFFAYYEDADLSYRAQLAGWKVYFTSSARVYHRIGATSSRVKGFTTYQTFKNLRLLNLKNTPRSLRHIIYPRFYIAYSIFQLKALFSRNAFAMLRGSIEGILLSPKKIRERKQIIQKQKVSDDYIYMMLVKDLPEDTSLRKLRSLWWKIIRKKL